MSTKAKLFKFPARVKTTLYLITATGAAGLTFQAVNSNLIPLDSPIASAISGFPETIRAGFNGVIRSSRAIYTITFNVVDYKYSLGGISSDSEEYRRKLSEVHLRSAKRILKLCESNKGFYVKAGQFVAALRHVPKEYTLTLSTLQDQAVPCHFKAIKEVLVNNLGLDLSEIFLSFDEQPIAAASIAQVHHALLKDNQEVAIKVQYPGLEQQMKIDITTMAILSNCVAWAFPEYRFGWIVSKFEKAISLELDFVQEGKNSEKTAENFKSNNTVRVPRVFWDLTTTQVLTMQFCHGYKVNDMESLNESGINPKKVAKALVEVFAEMIFVHGFLHEDPHPGNILVSPEGRNGFSLVLLDHGLYKELDEAFRLDYCQLWKALILLDSSKIQNIGERFGVGKYSRYFPVIFTGRTIDSGLLRSIISKLGASQQVRLLTYAKYAVYGLSTKLNHESDLTAKYMIYRLKATTSYVQLRLLLGVLELNSWMKDFGYSIISKFKRMLVNTWLFLSRNHLLLA